MLDYAEAKQCPDWPKWQEAIKEEMHTPKANSTWELVKRPPPGSSILGCKWVLCIKKNAAGKIEKYKAHLIARGFTQIHSVNFMETYTPVACMASFCLVLALAAHNSWLIDAFDFDSAFLNGVLGEDKVVYLEQPADQATAVTISLSDTYYGRHTYIYSFPLTHAYPMCIPFFTLLIILLIGLLIPFH
jgi:hypothetical protein